MARGLASARNRQNILRKRVAEIHAFVVRAGVYTIAEMQRRNSAGTRGQMAPLETALQSIRLPLGTNTFDDGEHVVTDAARANVFGPTFAMRVYRWARELKWQTPPTQGDVSWPEMYLDFILSTGTRAPVNLAKSRRYDGNFIVSYYALRDKFIHAMMMDGNFQRDLAVFCDAVRWMTDKLEV